MTRLTNRTIRTVGRYVHLTGGTWMIVHIYAPSSVIAPIAPITEFIVIPLVVVTGLAMWWPHQTRQLTRRLATGPAASADDA